MMRTILILAVLLCSGCKQQEITPEQLKQQIIDADNAMSRLALEEGFNNSILTYADSNIVKLGEGRFPVIGKEAFEASYNKDNDIKTISWIPVDAAVAHSGELGYSWGNWKLVAQDTVYFGNYFTLWKKQTDGSWKVLLDGGNSTPNPNN
ncbi:MAG: hypothetical protein U5K54_08435 [Cytophagales bacterium]|nr:hypothetical protein [Cytophagales bacterium]